MSHSEKYQMVRHLIFFASSKRHTNSLVNLIKKKPMRYLLALFLAGFSEITCALVHSPTSGMAALYVDVAAGISFVPPFRSYQRKSEFQIIKLMRERGSKTAVSSQQLDLPTDVQITSGIYDRNSDAYILIWIKEEPAAISTAALQAWKAGRSPLEAAAFGLKMLRTGLTNLRAVFARPQIDGVRSRILVQLLDGQTTYVGYFFQNQSELQGFEKLTSTLKVLAGRSVKRELFASKVWAIGGACSVLFLVLLTGCYVFFLKRKNDLSTKLRHESKLK
jgi:hypothetical protein